MSLLVSDANGEVVKIPDGESTIGRGPLLKVTDKRVSRNHARILYKDGTYSICPIHKNPCFHKALGQSTYSVLEKDVYKQLKNGDYFSLLPNDLIFRVVNSKQIQRDKSKQEKGPPVEKTTTSSAMDKGSDFLDELFDATEMGSSSLKMSKPETKPKPSVEEKLVTVIEKPKDEQSMPATVEVSASETKKEAESNKTKDTPLKLSSSVSSGSTNKPRSLPSWLSGISCDSVSKTLNEVKRKAPPPPKAVKRKNTETDNCQTSPPAKKRVKATEPNVVIRPEGKKTSTDSEVSTDNKSTKGSQKEEKATVTTKAKLDKPKEKKDKPLCPYGAKCYRKNPVHFKEYSHDLSSVDSVDTNISGDESDDDSERPLCPYGADCYRTNPTHRKEYKHTGPPAKKAKVAGTRQSSRRNKGKRSVLAEDSDDDGEPNTYDYNDSFIDDENADSGSSSYGDDSEDSDWAPAHRNDDDDENIKELLSDAKEFITNKKMRRT